MLEALWIFAIGLMPPLLSLWMMRHSEARTRAKLRQAMNAATRVRIQRHYTIQPSDAALGDLPVSDRYYLEGVGYLIGDITCEFNARSGYIRCAVNPQGPCPGCRYYEQREIP